MVRLIWENDKDFKEISEELVLTLKNCMEKTLEYEDFKDDAEISLTFTDNDGIKEQNALVRGIDKVTDVLSFPLLEVDDDGVLYIYDEDYVGGAVMLGDILISVPKAKAQAEEFGHSFLREICFLTVHSMLHLLGYDHEKGKLEESEMFKKQDEILNSLGILR